jgi:hypothetical protein
MLAWMISVSVISCQAVQNRSATAKSGARSGDEPFVIVKSMPLDDQCNQKRCWPESSPANLPALACHAGGDLPANLAAGCRQCRQCGWERDECVEKIVCLFQNRENHAALKPPVCSADGGKKRYRQEQGVRWHRWKEADGKPCESCRDRVKDLSEFPVTQCGEKNAHRWNNDNPAQRSGPRLGNSIRRLPWHHRVRCLIRALRFVGATPIDSGSGKQIVRQPLARRMTEVKMSSVSHSSGTHRYPPAQTGG